MSQVKIRTAILLVYLVLIALVPTGSFFLSQNFRTKSSASNIKNSTASATLKKDNSTVTKPKNSPKPAATPKSSTTTPSSAEGSALIPDIAFGPTLDFKLNLEGRPTTDQSARVFIGIILGKVVTSTPQYLLSFTVDLPKSGEYKNLSLAGLTVGDTYTAYIKGPAQIATSSAFIVKAATSQLNSGQALSLVTGDLNDDNVINESDYTIIIGLLGAMASSQNWNGNADFNIDGVVNTKDVGIILKNMNRTGETGTWISTPTGTTDAGGVIQHSSIGAPKASAKVKSEDQPSGYWLYVPQWE